MMVLVFSTINCNKKAKEIAKKLIELKLSACVNITTKITSIYYWEEEIVEDDEFLMIIKTTNEKIDKLVKTLKELHPYEIPEIAYFNANSQKDYLDWLKGYLK
ncbi:MAG TPA: divalent-cation tolerance protein CutA [Nautiliaceae bacterium]|nr:divalent-cation tolerance protein CutA [Nautiliaceae bacterium]